MDVFLRQMWTDKRLSFDGASELVIGSDMLHKIWLPDTYIGKQTNKQKIKLIQINSVNFKL